MSETSSLESHIWRCDNCGVVKHGDYYILRHKYLECNLIIPWLLTWHDFKGHSKPNLSLALLRICRLMHIESVPILYHSNTLFFENVAAMRAFRWRTDTNHSIFVSRIHLILPRGCCEDRALVPKKCQRSPNSLLKYLTSTRYSLAQDFPNLKGISLTIGPGLHVGSIRSLSGHLTTFFKYVYPLKWIQLIGLNGDAELECLHPILKKTNEASGRSNVQVKVSTYENAIGWINASLWWGVPGSRNPHQLPIFAKDSKIRIQLFKLQDGQDLSYTAGHSKAPR